MKKLKLLEKNNEQLKHNYESIMAEVDRMNEYKKSLLSEERNTTD